MDCLFCKEPRMLFRCFVDDDLMESGHAWAFDWLSHTLSPPPLHSRLPTLPAISAKYQVQNMQKGAWFCGSFYVSCIVCNNLHHCPSLHADRVAKNKAIHLLGIHHGLDRALTNLDARAAIPVTSFTCPCADSRVSRLRRVSSMISSPISSVS